MSIRSPSKRKDLALEVGGAKAGSDRRVRRRRRENGPLLRGGVVRLDQGHAVERVDEAPSARDALHLQPCAAGVEWERGGGRDAPRLRFEVEDVDVVVELRVRCDSPRGVDVGAVGAAADQEPALRQRPGGLLEAPRRGIERPHERSGGVVAHRHSADDVDEVARGQGGGEHRDGGVLGGPGAAGPGVVGDAVGEEGGEVVEVEERGRREGRGGCGDDGGVVGGGGGDGGEEGPCVLRGGVALQEEGEGVGAVGGKGEGAWDVDVVAGGDRGDPCLGGRAWGRAGRSMRERRETRMQQQQQQLKQWLQRDERKQRG